MRLTFVSALSFLLALAGASPGMANGVTVRGTELLLDGVPFVPNGAAGTKRLADLKATGANVVRTYGQDPGEILDSAQRAGLKVIVGFWLEHPRRGFNYGDRAATESQLADLQRMVERYRTHPALLLWGVGNEVETELTAAEAEPVWPAIEQAAKLVKTLDPAHPVMAVLADTGTDKVETLKRLAPSIDVLGLNAYGDSLLTLVGRARTQGWSGPIIVTELGAIGQWQAGKTAWGAPIEPTSTAKADQVRRYLTVLKQSHTGALPFYWGQKQEVTPTWHSLFLPTGEWTETVEAMAESWGGQPPAEPKGKQDGSLPMGANHAPRILSLQLRGPNSFDRAGGVQVALAATDPDGDPLKAEWQIMGETPVRGVGGDAEPVPPSFPEALHDPSLNGVRIQGLDAGHYRVFVTLRDGRGAAATGNIPFEVR
ncbi:glycoside hydrolase family 2 TIM barrel-domain containing protein [Roseixanthobacter pseudopolyaromaticivorans]|uniref:glycoside hydrolase family 2 TIM barrel-domain containing protein n=1 Tax=Xanthobacteraceae TaxID=335928 RepID=UPI00372BEF9B